MERLFGLVLGLPVIRNIYGMYTNRSLTVRSLINLVMIVGVLLGIFGMAYNMGGKTGEHLSNLEKRNVVSLQKISKISNEYRYFQDNIYLATTMNLSKKRLKRYMKYIKKGVKKIDKKILKYQKWTENEEIAKVLGETSGKIKDTIKSAGKMVSIYNNKKSTLNEKKAALAEFQMYGKFVSNDIEKINEMVEESVIAKIQAIQSQMDNFISFPLFIFSILWLALTTFILQYSVVTPVRKIQEGMNDFFDFLNQKTKTCNPIGYKSKDEFGQMSNKIDSEIENILVGLQKDEETITEVANILASIKEGDLSRSINKEPNNNQLKTLTREVNQMLEALSKLISKDITDVTRVLKSFSHRDFTVTTKEKVGFIETELSNLGDVIVSMLKENEQNENQLTEKASEINESTEVMFNASNSQAANLEEVAASIEEISGNIRSSGDKISEMDKESHIMEQLTNEGTKKINDMGDMIAKVEESQRAINNAIQVIDQIAFQTNILSLNAAVEAATAGEHGKGFAVVATEVRNLAAKSTDAANTIKDLVQTGTDLIEGSTQISGEVTQSFQHLVKSIGETSINIKEISTASNEQQIGISQISNTMNQLDQRTQENVAVANELKVVVEEVNKIAVEIKEDLTKNKY